MIKLSHKIISLNTKNYFMSSYDTYNYDVLVIGAGGAVFVLQLKLPPMVFLLV